MIKSFSAVVALVVFVTAAATAERRIQTGDAGLDHFNEALKRYVALKQRLHQEVPGLRVTNKSAEISNRSDMLAGAIQRARGAAPQGEFFDVTAARAIKARLATAVKGESVASLLARINDEPILKGPPSVHLRYPAASSLATMPAQLLSALPALPHGLEYRLAGRALILRDSDAALILDFLPDALPQ